MAFTAGKVAGLHPVLVGALFSARSTFSVPANSLLPILPIEKNREQNSNKSDEYLSKILFI